LTSQPGGVSEWVTLVDVTQWSPIHLRRTGPRWTTDHGTALKGVTDAGEKG